MLHKKVGLHVGTDEGEIGGIESLVAQFILGTSLLDHKVETLDMTSTIGNTTSFFPPRNRN